MLPRQYWRAPLCTGPITGPYDLIPAPQRCMQGPGGGGHTCGRQLVLRPLLQRAVGQLQALLRLSALPPRLLSRLLRDADDGCSSRNVHANPEPFHKSQDHIPQRPSTLQVKLVETPASFTRSDSTRHYCPTRHGTCSSRVIRPGSDAAVVRMWWPGMRLWSPQKLEGNRSYAIQLLCY